MKKVLIIENEKAINNLLAKILHHHGYDIMQAFNGREGILQIVHKKPDIVLCDISMPVMTGWELICLLKRMAPVNHIPIIFITAKVQQSDIELASSLGADGYFTKPFEIDELLPSIDHMVNGYTAKAVQAASAEQLFLTGPLSMVKEQTSYKVNLAFLIERFSQAEGIDIDIIKFLKEEDRRVTNHFEDAPQSLDPLKKREIKTVFSVDDDDIQNLLNEKLIKKVIPHAEVKSFNHPEKLLEHFKAVNGSLPDLMLLDIYMPNMNGFELLNELHTREIFIPTFMVSAAASQSEHQKPTKFPSIHAFIGKPLNVDKLNKLLH